MEVQCYFCVADVLWVKRANHDCRPNPSASLVDSVRECTNRLWAAGQHSLLRTVHSRAGPRYIRHSALEGGKCMLEVETGPLGGGGPQLLLLLVVAVRPPGSLPNSQRYSFWPGASRVAAVALLEAPPCASRARVGARRSRRDVGNSDRPRRRSPGALTLQRRPPCTAARETRTAPALFSCGCRLHQTLAV
ncbi:hypothetical protein BC628DRAFT_61370 [Trametes gibbosa]|nr:hypothetical protein BC628DRAFT_61370 [Trametes gibbosa]